MKRCMSSYLFELFNEFLVFKHACLQGITLLEAVIYNRTPVQYWRQLKSIVHGLLQVASI